MSNIKVPSGLNRERFLENIRKREEALKNTAKYEKNKLTDYSKDHILDQDRFNMLQAERKRIQPTATKYHQRDLETETSEERQAMLDYFKFAKRDKDTPILQKPKRSKAQEKAIKDKDTIIKRINDIIKEANDVSMGGRNLNYIKGGISKRTQTGKRKYPRLENRNYQYIDPEDGMVRLSYSADGYNLEDNMYPNGKSPKLMNLEYAGAIGETPVLTYGGAGTSSLPSFGGYGQVNIPIGGYGEANLPVAGYGEVNLPVAGYGKVNIPVGGARKRRPRSDKGKPRKANEWMDLVKAVSIAEKIPYNMALKKASSYRKKGFVASDFK